VDDQIKVGGSVGTGYGTSKGMKPVPNGRTKQWSRLDTKTSSWWTLWWTLCFASCETEELEQKEADFPRTDLLLSTVFALVSSYDWAYDWAIFVTVASSSKTANSSIMWCQLKKRSQN
jgi:hypothetical protein